MKVKLENNKTIPSNDTPPSTEWNPAWTAEPAQIIVEVQETEDQTNPRIGNSTSTLEASKIVVRTEEVLIVLFVLLLWVGAIALFFNRWGKIRMLEPYQPKFQQHRASCPLVEIDPITPPRQRTSLSKMGMGMSLPSTQCGGLITTSVGNSMIMGRAYRPRQNSVFVGQHFVSQHPPPRKSRSAVDIHSLVLNEYAEPV